MKHCYSKTQLKTRAAIFNFRALNYLIVPLFILINIHTTKASEPISIEISQGWMFKQVDGESWLPATVPGCVHTDLMANQKIEDPFYRLNEHKVQWIDKMDWEYLTSFQVEAAVLNRENIEMVFHGLDTYAEVYINGQHVLSADNMFRTWKKDCKSLLKEGTNTLRVVFESPISRGLEKYDANGFIIPVSGNDLAEIGQVKDQKKVSVYTRKAGYHFGWDWGARLVTSGIWRPIELKAWNGPVIRDAFARQESLTNELATISFELEIEANTDQSGELTVYDGAEVLARQKVQLQTGNNQLKVPVQIRQPKRWWPNGLGEQHLYSLTAKLETGKETTSKSVDIGLRTVEVIMEADSAGRSFEFHVNGQPVFMKGANYIPQDIFLNRVTPDKYEHVLQTAVESNMNMLRVWGGGIYEQDIFYEMCDKKGLLVWQDFMFACAMFPGDDAFLENVKLEAIDNVKRLRNHPSIALWCGNNENLAAWKRWGWEKDAIKDQGQEVANKIWKAYTDVFHNILPEVVKAYDNQRLYWASSPSAGQGIPEEYHTGDAHYWGVWWGQEPFQNYEQKMPRFMSEFGFQSFPDLTTVKKYAIEEDWDIFSEVMKSHQRSSIGNGTIKNYMLRDYKEPKDFPMFLYVGQVLQAEGMKFGMEAHRRNMPYCMGSLYWQIDDCWPVASWSSMDYYGRWKAQQYFTKKAFTPILISPEFEGKDLNVHIVSDQWEAIPATMRLSTIDFEGNTIWSTTETVTIGANESKIHFSAPTTTLLEGNAKEKVVFKAELLTENGALISSNLLYFSAPKNLKLPNPSIETAITSTEEGYKIKLSSNLLAKNVYLRYEGAEGFFSDNYFDLLPNEPVEVLFRTTTDATNFKAQLQIFSLVDSY